MSKLFTVLCLLAILASVPTPSSTTTKEQGAVTADVEAPQAFQSFSGTLGINGAWGNTHLKVYIISSGSEELDEAMRNAVDLWYTSIKQFTAKYGYRYLERLSYEITDVNPDITMRFVDSLPNNYCGIARWRYTMDYMITWAEIEISRSCVKTSAVLTFIVAAHEYGHALGLGHSTNNQDIMYPTVGYVAKLSTLDLYALAVAYEWVSEGAFRRPSRDSASLPSGIPFEHIEPAIRRFVRVFTQSELGSTVEVYDVAYGSTIDISVQNEIVFGNLTKLVFTGWYRGDSKVADTTTIRVRVTKDIDLVARYDVYYFVEVSTLLKHSAGWVRRGLTIELNTPIIAPQGEWERLRFRRWSDNSTEPQRTVTVLKPLKLEAIYAREFYASFTATHGSIDGLDGWYEEGSVIELRAPREVVWGNGTKAVFVSWDGVNSTEPSTKTIVRGPLKATARYRLQYYLEILSQQPVSHASGWYDKGSTLALDAGPSIRPAGEGIRYRFGGWPGIGEEERIEITVDTPKTIKASWLREYLISFENPVERSDAWVAEGGKLTVEARPIMQVSDVRRYVFKGWAGDIDDHDGLRAEITADRPKKALQLYDEELLVILAFEGEGGMQVDAVATIRHEGGEEHNVSREPFWAVKGSYSVVSVMFRNVDVKDVSELSVDAPGQHKLPVKVYSLRLAVKDLLGMPFATATVSVSSEEGVEAEETLDGNGEALFKELTYRAVNARLEAFPFSYSFNIDPAKAFEEVRLPLTPISAALLTATLLATVLTITLKIRKRSSSKA